MVSQVYVLDRKAGAEAILSFDRAGEISSAVLTDGEAAYFRRDSTGALWATIISQDTVLTVSLATTPAEEWGARGAITVADAMPGAAGANVAPVAGHLTIYTECQRRRISTPRTSVLATLNAPTGSNLQIYAANTGEGVFRIQMPAVPADPAKEELLREFYALCHFDAWFASHTQAAGLRSLCSLYFKNSRLCKIDFGQRELLESMWQGACDKKADALTDLYDLIAGGVSITLTGYDPGLGIMSTTTLSSEHVGGFVGHEVRLDYLASDCGAPRLGAVRLSSPQQASCASYGPDWLSNIWEIVFVDKGADLFPSGRMRVQGAFSDGSSDVDEFSFPQYTEIIRGDGTAGTLRLYWCTRFGDATSVRHTFTVEDSHGFRSNAVTGTFADPNPGSFRSSAPHPDLRSRVGHGSHSTGGSPSVEAVRSGREGAYEGLDGRR